MTFPTPRLFHSADLGRHFVNQCGELATPRVTEDPRLDSATSPHIQGSVESSRVEGIYSFLRMREGDIFAVDF